MVIKYFADVRELTGREDEPWASTAPTVRALLGELAAHHGAAFERRVLPQGGLSETMIVLVNGRNVEHLDGIDTPLRPGDVVALFPMVAGG
jgi:sulfur-carrier protein